MNKKERFNYLLQLYQSGNISIAEHVEFLELLTLQKYDAPLGQAIEHDLVHGFGDASTDLPPHIAEEIIRNIFKAEQSTARILPLQQKPRKIWRWAAAASILIIAATSAYFFLNNAAREKEQFASLIPATTLTVENNTSTSQQITLSDGSIITLKPNSIFHYPKIFNGTDRKVYLEGEAFFQVAKNPEKPFLVFYNKIVTKVLGTSFTINTNAKTGDIEVAVKTGRVQVYENEKIIKDNGSASSVIITPNQKTIYQIEKRVFKTALVDIPELVSINEKIANSGVKENFIYEQENLAVIFKQLEKAYGIELIVENSNLNNCVFTGDVTGQDLFTKLKIICLATNASYEVNDTKILIKGRGCN